MIAREIGEYAERHTDPEGALLQTIHRDTFAQVLSPRMLCGQLQGRLLALRSRLKQPKFILEIGTYTGYSAICLAERPQPDGLLITIDAYEELGSRIQTHFAQTEKKEEIQLIIGQEL